MVHFDGTARHQSVGVTDEPWLHQLLLAVSKHTKLAALINTSFNTRGRDSKIPKTVLRFPIISPAYFCPPGSYVFSCMVPVLHCLEVDGLWGFVCWSSKCGVTCGKPMK